MREYPTLVDQLKDNGTLIIPLITENKEQLLMRIQKTKEGHIRQSIALVISQEQPLQSFPHVAA